MSGNSEKGTPVDRGRIITLLAAGLAAALVVSCSSKPPACGSSETQTLVREMVLGDLRATFAGVGGEQGLPKDVKGFLDAFTSDLKVELSDVVSNGYDGNAKRYTCEGNLSATTQRLKGRGLAFRAAYSIQATEGGASKYLLSVGSGYGEFIKQMTYAMVLTHEQAQKQGEEGAGRAQGSSQTSAPDAPQLSGHLSAAAPATNDAHAAVVAAPGTTTVPVAALPAATQPQKSPLPAESNAATAATASAAAPQPTPTSASPSFDCAKAGTEVERMICRSPQIAHADAKLAAIYRAALTSHRDKEALRAAQSSWRKAARDTCSTDACLLDAYRKRLGDFGVPL